MTPRRRIAADTPLRECPERSVGLALPLPITDRLDGLVDIVIACGGSTTRKELVAALILGAPTDGDALNALVAAVRQANAYEGVLRPQPNASFLTFPDLPPGPRPRRRPRGPGP